MRVAILGCGSIGKRHLKHTIALGHAALVYDKDIGRAIEATRTYGGTTVATPPMAVDAVIVATPAAEHTCAPYPHDMPMFIEKPLAISAKRAASMLDGRDVQVGYNLRFHPALQYLEQTVDSGLVGAPFYARFYTSSDIATWPGRNYADALLECSHELDLARWILGRGTVIGAAVSAMKGDALAEVIIRHDSEALSSVHLDYCSRAYRRGGCINGQSGTLEYTLTNSGQAVVGPIDDPHQHQADIRACALKRRLFYCEDYNDTYREELESFFRCAQKGTHWFAPACDSDEAIDVLRWIDAAKEMAK